MQTHNVPVPWENDLGGFEVFQSGTQVLGPEIHGWYGAPGIVAPTSNAGRNAILVSLSQAVQSSAETALALQLVPVGTQYDAERATKKAAFDAAKLVEATARATYAAFIASQSGGIREPTTTPQVVPDSSPTFHLTPWSKKRGPLQFAVSWTGDKIMGDSRIEAAESLSSNSKRWDICNFQRESSNEVASLHAKTTGVNSPPMS